MRRVIFNQKGGVGKSSITCNLAAISACEGYRTLVVDLDVQGNSSHYLGYNTPQAHVSGRHNDAETATVAELLNQTIGLFGKPKPASHFVSPTPYENLSLIPASPTLELIEKDLESRYKIYKLRDALKELESDFDRIYIDTPPHFNFYSKSALIAADSLLVPFDCDTFSRMAMDRLLENVTELKSDHNPALMLEGIVVNQYNSQAKLPRQLIAELRSSGLPVLESYLTTSVKMKESHRARRPLVDYAPAHPLTDRFNDLFDELEEKAQASVA